VKPLPKVFVVIDDAAVCIVVDLARPAMGGSELIRHLHETRSLLSVVVVSGLIDSVVHDQHNKQPAPIRTKACEVWILLTMVEDAIAGSLKRDRVSVDVADSQPERLYQFGTNVTANDKILNLSPRQREVLSCLLAGDTLKEAALKLGLSEHTVGDYVKQVYKHFSVSSRAELLALFISREQA
jgi:DNA-binding NarL/FixJ family response regulator